MAKKARSPYVDELRDKDCIGTESHMQMFERLLKAARLGIHGTPGPRKPKKSS